MKANHLLPALFMVSLLLGCFSGSDSLEKAEKINNDRIDRQAVAMSDDAKKEAKEVAKKMVELSNSGHTEYELSKVALTKATNPEVRAYAQRVMNDHQADDRTLQSLAKQMNLTLPTELSPRSNDQLSKLSDMSKGTAFDLQYLTFMVDLNDDALDDADDLKDDAPNDAVKSYAKKLLSDDKKHKEQSRELKNVLD
ncbi:DUF4142 domain-containing protein [Spirosoma sp. SC4-14]|uniref:DUF4142 domain-containing protein n=1 Tax=Spirosoma sp. SC4-14 TaxID=3128900 RepID=UPI0030D2D12A